MTDQPHPNLDVRTRALKERIYATFTGLAVLVAVSLNTRDLNTHDDATPSSAFLALALSIVAISAAGLVAEVIAHQVLHKSFPPQKELWVMVRIALGALGSAAIPLLAIAAAWLGIIDLQVALWIGMGLYVAILVLVVIVSGSRSGLRPAQRLVATSLLLGLAALVIGVQLIAHLA